MQRRGEKRQDGQAMKLDVNSAQTTVKREAIPG